MADLTVKKVQIIGWGGGHGMTYGISYNGKFKVEESIGGMLKFTALEDSERIVSKTEDFKKDCVFYSAPNTIREMF